MTVHFVYSVCDDNFRRKLRRRAAQYAHRLNYDAAWVSPRSDMDTSSWPFNAPGSITKNVYGALQTRFDTRLYDLRERLLIKGGENDLLVGHPLPGQDRSVWNTSCLNGEFAARIGMWPLHHGLSDINSSVDHLIPHMDRILAITGQYWFDTWDRSIFADWKPKLVHLDMAIDTQYYPRIKKRFNPRGKRKFLFIGNGQACKGTHLLSMLFERAKEQHCVWVGGEPYRFRNLDVRPGGALTPALMEPIARECDFFITLGVSDANPTTILEAMAWGFPVCCTPQSGYYNMPEVIEMSTTNMKHNLGVLDWLQDVSEEWLLEHADRARATVEQRYNWSRFTATVLREINNVQAEKGLRPTVETPLSTTNQRNRS